MRGSNQFFLGTKMANCVSPVRNRSTLKDKSLRFYQSLSATIASSLPIGFTQKEEKIRNMYGMLS